MEPADAKNLIRDAFAYAEMTNVLLYEFEKPLKLKQQTWQFPQRTLKVLCLAPRSD